MVNPARIRKRVRALPRAPDGSAFQKCWSCEVLVPIALADMHVCKTKKKVKRFRGFCEKPTVLKPTVLEPIVLETTVLEPAVLETTVLEPAVLEPTVLKQGSDDHQARSPFRFFMESFVEMCEKGSLIDIDRKGFEAWKNMSTEEKQPYLVQAEKVDAAILRTRVEEVNDMLVVDDEADSAKVWMFDKSSLRHRGLRVH